MDSAWVFDGKTKRVHVWQVDETTKHNPRPHAEKLLGRPPKAREGDILGLVHIDGDHVKLESFYSAEIPHEVFAHFRSANPTKRVSTAHYGDRQWEWQLPQGLPSYYRTGAEWAQEHLAAPPSLKERLQRILPWR